MIPLPDDPLIAGFDVSGGGKAWNVIRFRRGLCGDPLGSDGKPLGPIRMPGEKDPDRSARIALCAELLNDRRPGHQLAALFVDSAFGAPIVSRLHALGYTNVYEINFGGESPDPHDYNRRANMARKCKDWLLLGSLPDEDGWPSSSVSPATTTRTGSWSSSRKRTSRSAGSEPGRQRCVLADVRDGRCTTETGAIRTSAATTFSLGMSVE
jgi:hypothetical protein